MLDPPMILGSFAKLGVQSAKLERAIVDRTQRLLPNSRMTKLNICILVWSFHQLQLSDTYPAFWGQLQQQLRARGLTNEDVKLSQLGPGAFDLRRKA